MRLHRGSFAATSDGSECDMRFLYCACAICSFLDDWSTIDTNLALDYINSCKAFDGGFGLLPQQESHGTVRLQPHSVHTPSCTDVSRVDLYARRLHVLRYCSSCAHGAVG